MTLDNKLGLADGIAPAREEERLTKRRALELFEKVFLRRSKTVRSPGWRASTGIYSKTSTNLPVKDVMSILQREIFVLPP